MSPSNIYIARVSSFVTEENIRAELAQLGNITRIDFTPLGKKPGFVENLASNIKSAFVHFEGPLNYSNLSVSIAEYGSVKMYPAFLCGSEYWILRTVQSPIPDTMMNNAQIVANCRFLENKVDEQAATIKAMEEKLEGMQRVVYQLLGGLFNHSSQGGTLSNHLNTLFENNIGIPATEEEKNTSKWGIWPTTRQGDENADRIAALESQVQSMTNFNTEEPMFLSYDAVADETQDEELLMSKNMKIDDDSVSTHSSMPELVDASSDSDNDSMPELVDASSDSDSDSDSDNDSNSMPELMEIDDDEDEALKQQEEARINWLRSQELKLGGNNFFGWF